MSRKLSKNSDTSDISSSNDQAADSPNWKYIIELRFLANHPLFQLGGRSGNVVVKLNGPDLYYHSPGRCRVRALWETDKALDCEIRVQQGWKVVACNGISVKGEAIMQAAEKAKKKGIDSVIAFEIPEMSARDLGYDEVRKSTERFKLRQLLGNKSLTELEELTDLEKKTYLRALFLQKHMVQSTAVFEAEVLLGQKKGSSMQTIRDMFTAAKEGNSQFLEKAMEDPGIRKEALLQRDGDGNVMLHHAADRVCAQLLIEAEPLALTINNAKGQTPTHTFLARNPDQMWATIPSPDGLQGTYLFCLDAQGLSAAMRTEGAAREKVKSLAPPWSDFVAALEGDVHDMHYALQTLQVKWDVSWTDGLAFHLFGEVKLWRKGQHTKVSQLRLGILWGAMERALEGCLRRDDGAEPGPIVKLTRMLLEASRGPHHTSLDPREPYRHKLLVAIERLEATSAAVMTAICKAEECKHAEEYAKLQAIHTYFPGKEADTADSIWQQLGIEPELRHGLQTPSWIGNPDIDAIFKDLSAVGALGQLNPADAAYDLLQLASAESSDQMLQLDRRELGITKWHAAWVRGICQGHLKSVSDAIQSACVKEPTPNNFCSRLCAAFKKKRKVQRVYASQSDAEKFCSREEAKGFMRISEKVVDILKKWGTRLKDSSAADRRPDLAKSFLMTSSTLVLDILGSTFIADSTAELVEVYERLINIKGVGNQSASVVKCVGVQGVFNGFAPDWHPTGGYRDIKLWIEVQCPSTKPHCAQQSVLVEMQLLLRGLFNEKHWSHLPYELRRGSFDWGHLKHRWSRATEIN